ncbi:MarR family transcriptional regulator [Pyruvatibacter sp.]|uniref:GbsR/MarR family transcriptional regulator n=1 Tax=Pyruvatibacter sp. TaxID=1981328 RepID=UPI003263773A
MTTMATATHDFIEQMGMALQHDGMSRTAARILAMLILSEEPAGLDEIAEHLQVSKSGVSTNTRDLERMGVIRRSTRPGDRQYYFSVADSAVNRLVENHVARLSQAAEAVQMALNTAPKKAKVSRERLSGLSYFYGVAIRKTSDILEEITGKKPISRSAGSTLPASQKRPARRPA